MKNMKKFSMYLFSIFYFLILCSFSYAEDEYARVAKEFSQSEISSMLTNPAIAVVPFSYIEAKADPYNAGTIISERLTNRIVKLKTYKVIDRQNLEKVLGEQKLQASGVVDNETAKSLGKILGVDAIITGTLMDMPNNRVEVNIKLIKTETAEILTTASMTVEKDWAPQAEQAQQQQTTTVAPQYAENTQITTQNTTNKTTSKFINNSFVDFFILSVNDGTMKLNLKNSVVGISGNDLSATFNGNGTTRYKEVDFPSINTTQSGSAFGLRMAGFSDYIGFGFDMMTYELTMKKQKTTFSLNGTSGTFTFYADDYLKIKTFLMDFGLYGRFSKKIVQPYIGLNIGLTINQLSSPYIYGFDDSKIWKKGIDSTELGFDFNIPIGVRVCFNTLSLFLEYRNNYNTFSFDRTIANEQDSITTNNSFVAFGLGLKF